MKKIDVLLIYPQLGSFDNIIKDIPLSLIYAATHTVKMGFKVKIIDLRVMGKDWEKAISPYLMQDKLLVGLSVMTGNPINNALKISQYIKENSNAQIVWGGPHPTILPEETLQNKYIDFVIRDWGSKALCQLAEHLFNGSVPKEDILGLGYKEKGQIKLSPPQTCFEMLDYEDLPYHLVDINGSNYNRLKDGQLIFPIYTSMGCPYKCNFCMSPIVYKKIRGKKWLAFDKDAVLDHIEYLSKTYDFNRIQIYDDDSFVDLDRMHDLLTGYIKRGFNKRFKLDFRGARINELDRMDEDYLKLLVEAGSEMMLIGMESGSPRVLKMMNKGITVDQIIRVNQKLARYPSLLPHYNFFSGIPGETVQDLILTKQLLMQLVKDHPKCYLGFGGQWKPLPGSVLTEIAEKEYGFSLPKNLEEWALIDSFDADSFNFPWYTPKLKKMIRLLQLTGTILDHKVEDISNSLSPLLGQILYIMAVLYRPMLRLRLRFNFTGLMFEPALKDHFTRNFGKLLQTLSK